MTTHATHYSIPKPFSAGDPTEWFVRFELCSKANKWDEEVMAVKFPTLLEGEALAAWLELSEEEQGQYTVAKEKIAEKLTPMAFSSLEEFHKRKLLPGEGLNVYVQSLKKMLQQAMPGLTKESRDQLILHQFISGLPSSISKQLRATGETKEIAKVVDRTRLLMAIEDEPVASVSTKDNDIRELREQVSQLSEQVAALSLSNTKDVKQNERSFVRCYLCQEIGHLQRNCPRRRFNTTRSCYQCGQRGHLARNCQGNERGTSGRGTRRPFN